MKPKYCTYWSFILTLFLLGFLEPLYGDTIFFEGGVVHNRNLELSYMGSSESPLVITSSGTGKAIINAGTGFGLQLNHCRNVTIENLVFKGNGRLTGNVANGMVVEDCFDII